MRNRWRVLLLAVCAASAWAQGLSLASRNARPGPDFLNGASIYQVWMRAFTPEGTLQAAAARLPYIADLGATIVYLSPLQMHSSYGIAEKGWSLSGPYGMKDYDRIDPEYGAEADLKAFAEQAHKLGLKVILDIVFYHMAIDNKLMQNPEYFMHTGDGKAILGTWGRPRPDFASAKLREYLVNNMVHWVRDVGLDGFRCDVAAGVPLDFWEAARDALDKVNPNAILLAEAEMPDQQLKAFDISYNFSYLKQTLQPILNEGKPAIRIRENWERQKAVWPHGARLVYSSDNHDQPRAVTLWGDKATYAAAVLNFTMDGIPFVYNGQEVADTTPTSYPDRLPIPWARERRSPWFAAYKKLFAMRKEEPALRAGELVWVNNSAPDSVVSFLRRSGGDQILVAVNLSNRELSLTLDLPAADFMPAKDLLTGTRPSTALSPGRIALPQPVGAYGALVLKRLPKQELDLRK